MGGCKGENEAVKGESCSIQKQEQWTRFPTQDSCSCQLLCHRMLTHRYAIGGILAFALSLSFLPPPWVTSSSPYYLPASLSQNKTYICTTTYKNKRVGHCPLPTMHYPSFSPVVLNSNPPHHRSQVHLAPSLSLFPLSLPPWAHNKMYFDRSHFLDILVPPIVC